MRRTRSGLLALGTIVAVLTLGGCGLLDKLKDSPTSPSPATTSLDPFVGSFTSTSTAAPGPTSCGKVVYVVTPTSTTAATITFSATCASNIEVTGNGAGTLSGSTLAWNAQGSVNQGGITCPFSFSNGTATPEGTGGLRVNYSGTVCGISVSGSEVVRK
jgi:hypothetical protein